MPQLRTSELGRDTTTHMQKAPRSGYLSRSPLLLLVVASSSGCDIDIGTRVPLPSQTLGQAVYRESCQRIAYTSQLSELQAGQRQAVDASGVSYRPMCSDGQAIPGGAPLVMTAVAAVRPTLISAIDAAVPRALYDDFDHALRGMMPSLEGPQPEQTAWRAGQQLVFLSHSDAAMAAMARLGSREGFVPRERAGGLLRGILATPGLHDSLTSVLPIVVESSVGASDAPAQAALSLLLQASQQELATIQAVPSPQAPDRTMNLLQRWLFTESAELVTLPAGQLYSAARRDHRGLPLIAPKSGSLPAPYVDKDKDGYADVDASGRFVDAAAQPIPFVTPFPSLSLYQQDVATARDGFGRALTSPGGAPLYGYQNLDDTVLAALLREAPALLDAKRDVLQLTDGLSALLGPRTLSHKTYGTDTLSYQGFDKTQSPLLDLTYSYLQLLTLSDGATSNGSELIRLLRAVELLLLQQESLLARTLDATSKAFDEAKKPEYATATLDERSTLYDDLAPILIRLLRDPDLVKDVLASLSDPATADLGQIIALLSTDSSQLFMNQNQLDTRGQPSDLTSVIGTFGKPVIRTLPDSDVDKNPGNSQNNRSILQRVLHLVHDANQAKFCNKDGAFVNIKIVVDIKVAGPAKPCALFQLDDLALYYLLSMADDSVKARDPYTNFINSIVDSGLKTQTQIVDGLGLLDNLVGIPGFGKYPTPAMLARLLFTENAKRADFFKTTLDLGDCLPARPGTLCSNQNLSWQKYYDGALFGLEAVHPRDAAGNIKTGVNFYTAFRPIVNAFAKHDECIQRATSGACQKTRNAGQILVDFFSVLHRHWPTVKSTFFDAPGYEPQQQRSGASRYEPLIAKLLSSGDLFASLRAFAPMLTTLLVDDGSGQPVSTVIAKVGRWLLDPELSRLAGPLVFRDGRTTALRNDGKPTFSPTGDPVVLDAISASAAGAVTPYDLLSDAYRQKRRRTMQEPARVAKWQAGISTLADLYLTARPGSTAGSYRLATPRLRPILLATIDLFKNRVSAHGAAQDTRRWVSESLYPDIERALTGPLVASSLDLVGSIAASQTAKPKLYQLLSSILRDPGPSSPDAPRFASLLYALADGLWLLADDGDLVPMMQPLSGLLAPDIGIGLVAILRRGLLTDEKQILLQVGQNALQPDGSGRHPAFYLGNAISEINRSGAGQPGTLGQVFTAADHRALWSTIGTFLSDERRGARRLLNVISTRSGS